MGVVGAGPLELVMVRRFSAENLGKIRAVSPHLNVTDVSPYFDGGGYFIHRTMDDLEKGIVAGKRLSRVMADAEVMLGIFSISDIKLAMPGLRWVQLISAGADFLEGSGWLESGITITTAKGSAAREIAEYVMGVILMHAKGLLTCAENQQARRWSRFMARRLIGKTLTVVGLGNIGHEVSRLGHALGMNVIGVRRSIPLGQARNVAAGEIVGFESLDEVLGRSDYVALCLPLTGETRGLMDFRRLAVIKEGAYLVNVSRGAVVDEGALAVSLRSGRLGGAALDVFQREPLPAASPLWDLPNLFISPHISGGFAEYEEQITDFFCRNLERYLAGEALLNVYDPLKGY